MCVVIWEPENCRDSTNDIYNLFNDLTNILFRMYFRFKDEHYFVPKTEFLLYY